MHTEVCQRCEQTIETGPMFLVDQVIHCRECHDDVRPLCPYCKAIFPKRPKRKTKCKSCGNDVIVRTNQKIYDSSLLTSDQALECDWAKKLEIDGEALFRTRDMLRKRFGTEPSSHDVVWSLLQHGQSAQDFLLKARFLYDEGRDHRPQMQMWARLELQEYMKSNVVDRVKILCAPDACESCSKLNGRILSIREAIETLPVPCLDCDAGWCRCAYSPVLKNE